MCNYIVIRIVCAISYICERFNLAVIKMPCWSLKLYFKVKMLIDCTTVAGATAVTSQLKENLEIKLQESVKITESS